MAKEPSPKPPVQISVSPIYEKGAPILFTNFTRFSHVGTDVILDVGHLDDQVLLTKINSNTQSLPLEGMLQVPAYIYQRFGMNVAAFLQLKKNINELWEKMRESGVTQDLGLEE